MTTPVCDFARNYANSDAVRAHMPGHKGTPLLGCEPLDLTEIAGADELFAPEGIIAESEANASKIFGCQTLYSTEGSSLCIRAMLFLALRDAHAKCRKPVIAAARNAHKTFLTAAALLDFDILWLPQDHTNSYLGCGEASAWEACLSAPEKPTALYLTSPDYLGGIADIRAAAAFCHANDMLLLVDNAHGAYLKFLPEPLHPIDLGADLCCDSAHKTLPVLTGGAYLHIAPHAPEICSKYAKNALSLFASTSPSYLILESLDLCNRILNDSFRDDLSGTIMRVKHLKDTLSADGWTLTGSEPLKLTVLPKPCGYTGTALAEQLQEHRIYVEFADPDAVVLMLSPQNTERDFRAIAEAFRSIPRKAPITAKPPHLPAASAAKRVLTPRQVLFYFDTETLPIAQCKGRICAEFAISCPPAVPIVICGERISDEAIACMEYYGIETCTVIKSTEKPCDL